MDPDMDFLPDAGANIELTPVRTEEQMNITNDDMEGTEIQDIAPCFGSSLDNMFDIDVQTLDMGMMHDICVHDPTTFPPALFDGFTDQDLELGMHPGIW